MNAKQVLAELEKLGSEQTRKTYRNHGVAGPLFGVKYGDLGKLVKKLGTDHELALALWDSGNHDARIVAAMICDGDAMSQKVLNAWLREVSDHVLSSAVAKVAARSEAGRKLLPKWCAAKGEWPAATGWMARAEVASGDHAPNKTEGKAWIRAIRAGIHAAPNRVRHSMNVALIAVGTYVDGLEEVAVAAADEIGTVEVDHGPTSCKTPAAGPYIRKAAAHHRKKLAKR